MECCLERGMPSWLPVAGRPIMVSSDAAVHAWPSAASPSFTHLCALLIASFVAAPSTSFAQPLAAELGIGISGMRGLVYTGLPYCRLKQPELTLSASAGYGVTEQFSSLSGARHRAQGVLAAAFAPLDWLSFGLRLDGRLEVHPRDQVGTHLSGHGDPRLHARVGRALSPEWSIGGELGLWFPGADAPSLEPKATSLDGKLLLAFAQAGWTALAHAGVRWDNSAQVGLDRTRLRVGDRVSLGLSSSNALLLALGLARRVTPELELFGELSGDVLVGSKAPKFTESPLRAAVGARYALLDNLNGEVTALLSLSERPSVRASAAWIPIEPRFAMLVGARYAIGFGAAAPAPEPVKARPPETKPETKPAELERASLTGKITDERGEPVPEVRVLLQPSSGGALETISDARGNYEFDSVPVGEAQLESTAVGFAPQRWSVPVTRGMAPVPARALTPKTESGVLRGNVRSFQSGEPLAARLSVRDARGKLVAETKSAAEGHLEIELKPGRYRVSIDAPGYRTFQQNVQIKGNDVSVLNADLRKQ